MFTSARQAWSRQRVIKLICAAAALLGLSAAIYLAANGQSGPATRGGGAAARTPAGATPGTAAAATGAAAADAPLKPADPARVAVWHAGPAGAALESLSKQLGNALMAHAARQFLEMKYACANLAGAVTSARQDRPIPDASMQRSYHAALAKLATAAADCRAAISARPDGDEAVDIHENVTLLNQAVSALGAGAKDLYRATYMINIIKG